MNNVDFFDSLKQSYPSVQIFCNYVRSLGITDMSLANMDGQKMGYDVLVKRTKVEVKLMTYKSMVCLEEVGDMDKPGWMHTSQADILAEVRTDVIYFFNMPALQKLYHATKQNYKLRYNRKQTHGRYQDWTSAYYMYPLIDLNGFLEIKKIKLRKD